MLVVVLLVKYCEDHCSPTAGQLEGLSGGLRLIRRMRKEKLSAGGRRPTIAVVAHFVFFKRLFEIYKCEGEELRIKNCQILAVSEEEFKEV